MTTLDHRKRKTIPLAVKLDVALARFGLTLADVQFDHAPALELREWDEAAGDTIPPANDPEHIHMLLIAEHKAKTFGRRGEKTATTAGSDIAAIAKVKRLTADHEAARRRMLAKDAGEPKPRSKWASRPFPKRRKASK